MIRRLPFDANSVPRQLAHEGKVTGGARWRDKEGLHLVLLAESTRMVTDRDLGSDAPVPEAHLYAYHYVQSGNRWKRVWMMADSVPPCDVDVTAEFVPGSLTLTDLDRDGTAEVSFLYRLACRGDVSPATQKLLMYEGRAKYALRGETRRRVSDTGYAGGGRSLDPAFARAPARFKTFALGRWDRYRNE